ncbi:MAG: hypothetical protein WA971_07650, partial [Microbacterium sp.]
MAVDVKALVAKARQEFAAVEPVDQEVELGGEKITARFTPISGPEWRDLTAKHPERPGGDQALGYDLTGVMMSYPRVSLVDGDDVQDVTAEWADMC